MAQDADHEPHRQRYERHGRHALHPPVTDTFAGRPPAESLAERRADAVRDDQPAAGDLEPLLAALEDHCHDPAALTASVDGANMWARIRYIVMPLSLPALITIGVLSFREAWNEFTLVLVLTTSPGKRTLPYELYLMQGIQGIQNYPAEAAFTVLTILPFILVYARIEKYIVAGITTGSVK